MTAGAVATWIPALARGRSVEVSRPFSIVLAASIFFAALAVRATLTRWAEFQTNAFDLAFFDQIVWNTAHGRWWETTFIPYSFAGQHLEPVLLLYAAAYRLGAESVGPPLLLVSQALVVSAAALPLYAAARRFGVSALVACALAFAYLANPYLHRALAFDFHPEVMVVLPTFTAAFALATGRSKLFVGCALSVLLFKEDAAFVALALAACAWRMQLRAEALAVAAVALVYLGVGLGLVMPHFRDGIPSDLNERYVVLYEGPGALLQTTFEPARLATAARFLASTAPAGVAAPWTLPLLVPGLAAALFSTHPPQQALELHYAAEVVPVALLGALFGARALAWRMPAASLAALVLVPAVLGALAFSPASPLHGRAPKVDAAHLEATRTAIALVPRSGAVSAQSGLLPRLSQREQAWEFPRQWEEADWVLIDLAAHRSTQSVDSGYDAAVEAARARLVTVYARDGVVLLRREDAAP